MGIEKYYTQSFDVYEKINTKTSGVSKQSLTLLTSIKGILDKETSRYNFTNYRSNYEYTHILFTSPNSLIVEDRVIDYAGEKYDVVSVINPLHRNKHIECLLKVQA
jgi:hypothetical protein